MTALSELVLRLFKPDDGLAVMVATLERVPGGESLVGQWRAGGQVSTSGQRSTQLRCSSC